MANEEVRELVDSLKKDWPLIAKVVVTEEHLTEILSTEINRMIRDQFPWLIHLLYRIDISETKLRNLLAANKDADAGKVIAHLVIERQKQKFAQKKTNTSTDENIPDEEKW